MSWLTGIALYLLLWWVTLLAMLPLWVAPTEPGEFGHDAGYLGRKLALTSAVAAVGWGAIYLVVRSRWLGVQGS